MSVVAVLLAVAALLVVPSGAASADVTMPGGGSVPSDSTTEVVNRCVLYANASSFGADCAGGSAGTSIKDILGHEKFPECRWDPLPDDMSPPDTHHGEDGAWYLKTCLKGIKPDGTGDFERTTELEWFPAGKDVTHLTHVQSLAWSFFKEAYPMPIPQFGPASVPRVLIPTYFWLSDDTGSTITRTVFDGVRDVPMRARVEQTEISPGRYPTEHPLVCPGRGMPYDHSRGIYAQGSNCQYQYDRSSAFRADDTYEVSVQANWVVEYQLADGSWKRLGMFPMDNIFYTPVNEIQTVVG